MYCSPVSHDLKVVKMTECEVIQRRAAGESRQQNGWGQPEAWLESALLLLDFLMSSPELGH